MEILGNSGRRMGNVLENHGNPSKFWEKDGKCAGKSWKSSEISGRRMGNVLENYEKCAGKSWKS